MRWSKLNRELSLLLAVTMVFTTIFGLTGTALAATPPKQADQGMKTPTFIDLEDSYAKEEIQALESKGILSGYADGSFGPGKAMSRAEFAKVLVLSANLTEDPQAATKFRDVGPDAWYKGYVGALVKAGITEGTSEDLFTPDGPVTREQLAVFFVRGMGLEAIAAKVKPVKKIADLDNVSPWARTSVQLAFEIGFIQGSAGADGSMQYLPGQHAQRQALARLAYEFLTHKEAYLAAAEKLAGSTPSATPASTASSSPSPSPSTSAGGGGGGGGGSGGGTSQSTVASVRSTGTDTVEVMFDNSGMSVNAADYSFSPALVVKSAVQQAANNKAVVLTTEIQEIGKVYSLLYKGTATGKTITGTATVLSVLEDKTYNGNYRIASGVEQVGPESGNAVINGLLQLDPGADKELLVRNIQVPAAEILSGASNSIKLQNVRVTRLLTVKAAAQPNPVRIIAAGHTEVVQTNVESKAILDVQSGSLGRTILLQGAAQQKVELRGNFDGDLIIKAPDAQLTVTQGAVVAGVVQLTANGAKLEVAQDAAVAKVEIASDAVLVSKGRVAEAEVTAKAIAELSGNITKATVKTAGASVKVMQDTRIGSLVLQASATVQANGIIDSLELASEDVILVLEGTNKEDVYSTAIKVAEEAIHSLPAPAALQLSDRPAIEAAWSKVRAVKALGKSVAAESLKRLNEAEAAIMKLLAGPAQEALNALPSETAVIGLDQASRSDAETKLKAAREAIQAAKAAGVKEEELANRDRILKIEQRLARLQELSAAIAGAQESINHLPEAADIKSEQLLDIISLIQAAEAKAENARTLAAAAGIPSFDTYIDWSKLTAANKRVEELQGALSEVDQAIIAINTSILQLPSLSQLTLKAQFAVNILRVEIDGAKLRFQITDDQISNLHVLVAVEAKLAELRIIMNEAVQAANAAIEQLPESSQATLKDKTAVEEAHAKVTAAREAGAEDDQIKNLTKLESLLAKLQELEAGHGKLIEQAAKAIQALPVKDALTLGDEPLVQAARQAVTVLTQQDIVFDEQVVNVKRLEEAEAQLVLLKQGQAEAIAAAIKAIEALPALENVTPSDKTAISEARRLADMAIAKGGKEEITNLTKLVSLEDKLQELEAGHEKLIDQAAKAIQALPVKDVLTLGDEPLVQAARQAVTALTQQGIEFNEQVVNVKRLEEAEAQLVLLKQGQAEAIAAAIMAIEALPEATQVQNADGSAIAEARRLADLAIAKGAQKADLTNYSRLTAAEAAFNGMAQAVMPKLTAAVYAGELVLVGTAEPGGTLQVKAGAAQSSYPIPLSGSFYIHDAQVVVKAGEDVVIVSKLQGKRDSAELKVPVMAPISQAAAPKPQPFYEGDWLVHGIAEPGAVVRLIGPDGTVYGEATADKTALANGMAPFSILLAANNSLPAGALKVNATLQGKAVSLPVTLERLPLSGGAATAQPAVKELLLELAEAISGTTEPYAILKAEDGKGVPIGSGIADQSGLFTIQLLQPLTGFDPVRITAKAPAKAASLPLQVTVFEPTETAATPVLVNQLFPGDFTLQVQAEASVKLEVRRTNGQIIATGTANTAGKAEISLSRVFLIPGETLAIYAKTPLKKTSEPLTAKVQEPAIKTTQPTLDGELYLNSSRIIGNAEFEAAIYLVDSNGQVITSVRGQGKEGKERQFTLELYPLPASIQANDTVQLIAVAAGKLPSEPVLVQVQPTVGQTELGGVVGTVFANGGKLKGWTEPGAEVLLAQDGWHTATKAGSTGYFELSFITAESVLKEGTQVQLTAAASGKGTSDPRAFTVQPISGTAAVPVLYQQSRAYQQGFAIEGTLDGEGFVLVRTPDGRLLGTAPVYNGYFQLELWSLSLEAGTDIEVSAAAPGFENSSAVGIPVQALSGVTTQPVLTHAQPTTKGYLFTGTAEKGAIVELWTGKDQSVLISRTRAWDGTFLFEDLTAELPNAQDIWLVARMPGKKNSPLKSYIIRPYAQSGTPPLPQLLTPLTEGDTVLSVNIPVRSHLKIVRNGITVVKDYYGEGKVQIPLNMGTSLSKGDTVYIYVFTGGYLETLLDEKVAEAPTWTDTPIVYGELYAGSAHYLSVSTAQGAELQITKTDGSRLYTGTASSTATDIVLMNDLAAGEKLLVKARMPGYKTSVAASLTVHPAAAKISLAPVLISTLYEDDTKLLGFAAPGAAVAAYAENGATLAKTLAGADGTFSMELGAPMAGKQAISLTAQTLGEQPSATTPVPVLPLQGTTAQPVIHFITDKQLMGTAELGASIWLNGALVATAGADGTFLFSIEQAAARSSSITIYAKQAGKKLSAPATAEAASSSITAKPYVIPIAKANYSDLYVMGESGSTFYVYDSTGTQISKSTPKEGTTVIPSGRSLKAGEILNVRAQASGKTMSEASPVQVLASLPKAEPPVLLNDIYYGTLLGTAAPGADIFITGPLGYTHLYSIQADMGGRFVGDITPFVLEGEYKVSAYRADLQSSTAVKIQYTKPAQKTDTPVLVGSVLESDGMLSILAAPFSEVTVKDAKGNRLDFKTTKSGFYTVKLPNIKTNDVLNVTAQKRGQQLSENLAVTVGVLVQLTPAPVLTGSLYEDSTYAEGTAEAGTEIWAKDRYGNLLSKETVKATDQGRFKLDLDTASVLAGDEILFYARKPNLQDSKPLVVKVSSYKTDNESPRVSEKIYTETTEVYVGLPSSSLLVIRDSEGLLLGMSKMETSGKLKLDFANPLKAGDVFRIYAKPVSGGKNAGAPAVLTVLPMQGTTETPTVSRSVYEGDYSVLLTYPEAADVEVYHVEGQTRLTFYTWNSTFEVPGTVKAGDTIRITAKETGKQISKPLLIRVLPIAGQTAAPTVTASVYGSKIYISGQAEPGAKINIYQIGIPDIGFRTSIQASEADGTFALVQEQSGTVPLKPGASLTCSALTPGKQESAQVMITVTEGALTLPQPQDGAGG